MRDHTSGSSVVIHLIYLRKECEGGVVSKKYPAEPSLDVIRKRGSNFANPGVLSSVTGAFMSVTSAFISLFISAL